MRATLPIGVFSSGGHKKAATFFRTNGWRYCDLVGQAGRVSDGGRSGGGVGHKRPDLSLQRHLAARHQYRQTIVTFLMVFLIQNTQNHDTEALQVKLSELILAMKGADNKVAGIEDATEDELQKAHQKVKRKAARKKTDSPLRDA